jgi:flagellar protein FlaF
MLMSHEIEENIIDLESNSSNAALSRSRGAYKTTQKITEKEEDTDAVVLMIAADKLLDAKKLPEEDIFEEVLLYNKSIWTVIQSEMTEAHPLPLEIKTNLISLSLFIDNQTDKAIGCRDPEMLDSLININRNIAAGLMHRN